MAGGSTSDRKLWEADEDLQLCKSWRFVSHDAEKGTDQKKAQFWDNVLKHYFDNFPDAYPRTTSAMIGRWKSLKTELFQ